MKKRKKKIEREIRKIGGERGEKRKKEEKIHSKGYKDRREKNATRDRKRKREIQKTNKK